MQSILGMVKKPSDSTENMASPGVCACRSVDREVRINKSTPLLITSCLPLAHSAAELSMRSLAALGIAVLAWPSSASGQSPALDEAQFSKLLAVIKPAEQSERWQ